MSARRSVCIIVAMTEARVIGKDNRIPWNIPEDLRKFRELTFGQTVVMGRNTFQSIGKPLPGRRNIVVSTTLAPQSGIELCTTFDEAIALGQSGEGKVFCIGGREIYRRALEIADCMYISLVKGDFAGDTSFPEYDREAWSLVERTAFGQFDLLYFERNVPTVERTRK